MSTYFRIRHYTRYAFRSTLSALRSTLSALRSIRATLSALRFPLYALRYCLVLALHQRAVNHVTLARNCVTFTFGHVLTFVTVKPVQYIILNRLMVC